MQYSDLTYLLLFLPILILIYTITKKKYRYIVLLIFSYIFFYSISKYLIIYFLLTTLIVYITSLILDKLKVKENNLIEGLEKEERKLIKKKYNKRRKITLVLGILLVIFPLTLTKYISFISLSINDLFSINMNLTNLLAPIGISFYSLEMISYLTDIYRGKIIVNKNFFKLSLYLTYFPKLMEGPITRYEEVSSPLYEGSKITYKNLTYGLQRIIYGLIKKIVITSRVHLTVETIFNNYTSYDGGILLIGIILYIIELYMDFSGVMDIVIGTSEIFNIKLTENFKRPFFSRSISDFWSRWHVTLGLFFKDYVFYPVSLSKFSRNITLKARKVLGNHFGPLISGTCALLLVWLLNGLWHGAGYHYILFGLYHFTFILLGNIFSPLINKFYEKTNINKDNFIIKSLSILRTTIIVIFGETFFKATSSRSAFYIIKNIFTNFNLDFIKNHTLLKLGLDNQDIFIIILTLIIVFIVGIFNEKNISIRDKISNKPLLIRWIIYYSLIFYLLIFGAYLGPYLPVDPMYASF